MITKEDSSDLQALIENHAARNVDAVLADKALEESLRKLKNFIYKLETKV